MPETDNGKIAHIFADIAAELHGAVASHPSMHSLHEGYAVILEEVEEFWREVQKNPRRCPERNANARAELIQVAAMAIRILHDVL